MSNVGVYSFPRDYRKDLPQAYEGEVPAPYYRFPLTQNKRSRQSNAGGAARVAAEMPCPFIPPSFADARVVSLERLEESLERMARREEAS